MYSNNSDEIPPVYSNNSDVSTKSIYPDISRLFPILLVHKDSKRPAELHGIHSASHVRGKGRPVDFTRFNAGVRCGAWLGAGLLIVDVDPRNGGLLSFDHLRAAYGDPRQDPGAWVVNTPSGGFHLYFLYDPNAWTVKKSSTALGRGIDVLGDGSYALIPPSTYGGVSYTFEEDPTGWPLEAPLWLLGLVGVGMDISSNVDEGGGTVGGSAGSAIGAVSANEPGAGGTEGEEGTVSVDEAEIVLTRIHPDCGRDDWLRIGMGLKHPTGLGDTPAARALWIQWSKGNLQQVYAQKFNQKNCLAVWNSIKGGKGGAVTWASVVQISLSQNSIKDLNMNTNLAKEIKESSVPVFPTNTEESLTTPLKEEAKRASITQPIPPKEEAKMASITTLNPLQEEENQVISILNPPQEEENQVISILNPPQEGENKVISINRVAHSVDVSTQKSTRHVSQTTHPYYSRTADGKVRTPMLPKFIEKLKTKRLLIDVMAHIPNPIDDGTMFLYPFPDNIVVGQLAGKPKAILSVDENLQVIEELTEKDIVNKLAVYMQESCERRDLVDDTNDIRVRRQLVEHFVSALIPIPEPAVPYVAPGGKVQLCIHRSTLNPCNGPTPAWDELLKGIKTKQMRDQLMAFIAVLLLHPDIKLLQYVLMTGTGGLGKSSVLIAVREWLGKAAGTFRITETRFGMSAILNRRLVYLDEISDFRFLESDIFKSCTGSVNAKVSLEEKFGKAFDFNPKYTMWMLATNKVPTLKQDSANMRRVIPIVFARPRGIAIKRIDNMEQRLIDEMPHFAWKCDQVLKNIPIKDGMIQSVQDTNNSMNTMHLDMVTSKLGLRKNPESTILRSEITNMCRTLGMHDKSIGAVLKQLAAADGCGFLKIRGIRYLEGYEMDPQIGSDDFDGTDEDVIDVFEE